MNNRWRARYKLRIKSVTFLDEWISNVTKVSMKVSMAAGLSFDEFLRAYNPYRKKHKKKSLNELWKRNKKR